MKIITETRQICIPKSKEITIYETIDGQKFENEAKALEHEEKINKRKIVQ